MNSQALEIVDDFLRSNNPQERRNAATALAIVGTTDSLQRLIRTATSDADTVVRTRAEEELGRLREARAEEAGRQLADALHRPDSEAAAYNLLARMSAMGIPLLDASGTGSWFTRLRRAVRLIAANPFRFGRQMRLATVSVFLMLIIGMVVGAGLAIATGLLLSPSDTAAVLTLSAVLVSVLILTALARTLPMTAHFDRHAAIVVELLAAAAGCGLVGLAVGGIMALFEPWESDATWHVLTQAVVLIVTGVSVRLGVFLASGVFNPPYNFLLQSLVGSVWGIVAATLLLAPLSADGDWITSASYTPFVLIAFGFAVAASWIDAIPPVDRLLPRRVGIVAIAMSILVFVFATGWITMGAGQGPGLVATGSEPVTVNPAASGRQLQEIVIFEAMPARVNFEIKFPQWVRMGVASSFGQDLAIRLDETVGRRGLASYDDPDPPRISRFLRPGNYTIIIGRYSELDAKPAAVSESQRFGIGAAEVLAVLMGGPERRYRLSVTLNADQALDPAQQQ